MIKYIFLTDNYLPRASATALCVHQIAREISRRGEETTIICYNNPKLGDNVEGIKVIKINPPIYITNDSPSSRWQHYSRRFLQLYKKFVNINRYPLRSWSTVRQYVEALRTCIERDDEVIALASCNPLEAVVALAKAKSMIPNIKKIVFYSADTLSNEGSHAILPASIRKNMGYRWERKLFSIYDCIMVMECHKDHYFSDAYNKYVEKMSLANFPLLISSKSNLGNDSDTEKRKMIIFAGTLSMQMRNPQYALNLFCSILDKVLIKVLFMGNSDCDSILKPLEKQTGEDIKHIGMQPHDVAADYISRADVLLSIGNKDSDMAPSKIYEYMGTGKPIIHFYCYEKDPCLKPLRQYGNALLVNENETYPIENIIDFINDAHVIPFEEVRRKFITSTPEYSANIIQNL